MKMFYCCKITSVVIAIGFMFLLAQTGMLVLSFVIMGDVRGHTSEVIDWLRSHAEEEVEVRDALIHVKNNFIRVRARFFLKNVCCQS